MTEREEIELVVRESSDGELCFVWLEHPSHDAGRRPQPIDMGPLLERATVLGQQPQFEAAEEDIVREMGSEISQALATHEFAGGILSTAATGSREHELRLVLDSGRAERVPWESLWLGARFLGLDARWTIARLVTFTKEPCHRVVDGELRIAVVIAAADRDPLKQWAELCDALAPNSLPLVVDLWTCMPEREQQLRECFPAAATRRLEVHAVPTSATQLADDLRAVAPQILHVHAHGHGDYLRLDHRLSAGGMGEPIYLGAEALGPLAFSLWLLSLNCCGPRDGVESSLAYAMVKRGVPAVLAMRDIIEAEHAHRYASALLEALLPLLEHHLSAGGREPLRFDALGPELRRRLLDTARGEPGTRAARWPHWTLPVLYRRAGALELRRSQEAPMLAELDKLQELRTTLPPENPAWLFAELDRRIATLERDSGVGERVR